MEENATLPAKLSVLPESWVSKIFSHMSAYYGTLFLDRWRDADLAEVKRIQERRFLYGRALISSDAYAAGRLTTTADGASVSATPPPTLGSAPDNPECFKAALKALIEGSAFPPTLPEFVALCRRHYQRPVPANAILTHQAGEPLSREEARARFAEIGRRFVSRKDAAAGEMEAA